MVIKLFIVPLKENGSVQNAHKLNLYKRQSTSTQQGGIMTVKMNIVGGKAVRLFLKKKKVEVNVREQIGLNKAAIFMQGEVKESIAGRRSEPTSVDTGTFLNSVQFKTGKDDAVIFSQTPYAKHLEFGTSRIPPRRHFNNSKSRNKEEVVRIINKEIKKI